MTPNEALDGIALVAKSGQLAVWCGAGISIPSGLPGAEQLVAALLDLTELNANEKTQVAEIVPRRLPFERLMEVLLDTMDLTAQRQFLDVFRLGAPAPTHMFLAAGARSGFLRTICTTNFDVHIETALEKATLERSKGFVVHYDPQSLTEVDWNSKSIRVLKVHGTVEIPADMAVTVRRVASPGEAPLLRGVLEQVFQGSGVLVLGYSFSDRFDISPVLFEIGAKVPETFVLVIDHADDVSLALAQVSRIGDAMVEDEPHPLHGYPEAWRLRVDTRFAIDAIVDRLHLEPGPVEQQTGQSWNAYLAEFMKGLDLHNHGVARTSLAGSMLTMVGAHAAAIPYLRRVEAQADALGDDRVRLVTYQNLMEALTATGQLDEARDIARRAESIAGRLADGAFGDHLVAQLATVYRLMGDEYYRRSLELSNQAIAIAQREGETIRIMPHLTGLAHAWMKLGDFDAALQAYGYADRLVSQSGDLYRRGELCGNVGSLAYTLRNYDDALRWYDEAIRTSKLCGDRSREGIHLMNRGNVYVKQARYAEALEDYGQARDILTRMFGQAHPLVAQLDRQRESVERRMSTDEAPVLGQQGIPEEN